MVAEMEVMHRLSNNGLPRTKAELAIATAECPVSVIAEAITEF